MQSLTPIACILALTMSVASASSPASRPATVKVAAVQCSSHLGAVDANRTKLTKLVEEAAGNGARIIVLPETSITGYVSQDLAHNWHIAGRPLERGFAPKDPGAFAETVPGPSTDHFCKLAGKLGVYVTVPLLEVDRSDPARPRYFNTVCLASPAGKLVAHYRKLNPWPYPEQSWATPGDRGIQTFDTEFGRVGLAICYDIHFILEKYKDQNLWALLYPIAWVDDEHPAEWFWHKLPRRVSRFNHYVIGANWSTDRAQAWRGYGFSTIISPDGKVIATARSLHGSEIVYAEIATQKP